jgi:hypothetical protein
MLGVVTLHPLNQGRSLLKEGCKTLMQMQREKEITNSY